MGEFIDLSHPILDQPPCTFSINNPLPEVRFTEGESHGVFFVTSVVNNLYSNTCTHIDFPGHISEYASRFYETVGKYPIERFIGSVAILDFSSKLLQLSEDFNERGEFIVNIDDKDKVLEFLQSLDKLSITASDLTGSLDHMNVRIEDLRGILIYTGLSRFWKYEIVESWNYAYFFNPFLAEDACDLIVNKKLSFVGIDCLQVEHPIIDYSGDELPLVRHPECRQYVKEKLKVLKGPMNHRKLLGHDVLIYENMRIPKGLVGQKMWFSGVPLNLQIPELDDNALARPYVVSARQETGSS
ncbi:MAG TPA: cyclase family protein [Pyrinomonadaceae bacterium]|nr:cyclase family protein [Pyrinomonadaceae bacterium]